MNTIEILVTCLALSLDCFVVMMARGRDDESSGTSPFVDQQFDLCGFQPADDRVGGSLAGSLIKKSACAACQSSDRRADPVCAGLLPADPGVSAESD